MKARKPFLRISIFAGFVLSLATGMTGPPSCGQPPKKPSVEKSVFGRTKDGTVIELFTLKNSGGTTAKIIGYGATLQGLSVADKAGKFGDVVLGFDDLEGYLGPHPYFGGTIGRVGNRIAKGRFTLDGKEYS